MKGYNASVHILQRIRVERPTTIGIDGKSGAGKSTLAAALARALDATVIPYDYFHKFPRTTWTRETNIRTFGDAEKLHWVIGRLRAGESFSLDDLYNHADGKHTRRHFFEAKPLMIIEGIVTARLPLDFKIFLETDDAAAMERARVRDVQTLGMTDDLWEIKKHLFHTQYGRLVDELKSQSHIVIDTSKRFLQLEE